MADRQKAEMSHWILVGHTPFACTLEEWSRSFDSDERVLKQETVKGVRVSTVFVGIDYSFSAGDPAHVPSLFETLCFPPHDGPWSDYCARSRSWDEAMVDHHRVVRLIRAGRTP